MATSGTGTSQVSKKSLDASSHSKTSDSFSKEATVASKNCKGPSKSTQDTSNDILNTAQILQESPALDQADREPPQSASKPKTTDPEDQTRPSSPVSATLSKKGLNTKPSSRRQPQMETEIARSPFLTDLIQKINSKEQFDCRIIRTHVVECAVDQQGSRFI